MDKMWKNTTPEMEPFTYQSPEAAARGICHTGADCNAMYGAIPVVIKQAAVDFIIKELPEPTKHGIIKAQLADPENWIAPYHLMWGMSFRNMLRMNKMGEKYFDIDNLDCIQSRLLEDALWGIVKK